jgi:hypothetical protein
MRVSLIKLDFFFKKKECLRGRSKSRSAKFQAKVGGECVKDG